MLYTFSVEIDPNNCLKNMIYFTYNIIFSIFLHFIYFKMHNMWELFLTTESNIFCLSQCWQLRVKQSIVFHFDQVLGWVFFKDSTIRKRTLWSLSKIFVTEIIYSVQSLWKWLIINFLLSHFSGVKFKIL